MCSGACNDSGHLSVLLLAPACHSQIFRGTTEEDVFDDDDAADTDDVLDFWMDLTYVGRFMFLLTDGPSSIIIITINVPFLRNAI